MTPDDQKAIIIACVERQFIPEVMIELHRFLQKYRKNVIATHEYKIITGYQGEVVIAEPVILDLRPIEATLIKNLHYGLTQK